MVPSFRSSSPVIHDSDAPIVVWKRLVLSVGVELVLEMEGKRRINSTFSIYKVSFAFFCEISSPHCGCDVVTVVLSFPFVPFPISGGESEKCEPLLVCFPKCQFSATKSWFRQKNRRRLSLSRLRPGANQNRSTFFT